MKDSLQRIDSLDYLRGFMATIIMIYHYSIWLFGNYDSETLLGRLGIYGVSTFYVISGLTLYIVYKNRLSLKSLHTFFIKRFFRIYPLLWVCILLNIVLLGKSYSAEKIWLNVTGLFGLIAPDQYIPTGAWSIGNELVFYLLFPILLLSMKRVKWMAWFLSLLALLISIYFAFFKFSTLETLAQQWSYYVHPLNQLFLFTAGVTLGYYVENYRSLRVGMTIMIASILLFTIYPVFGDKIFLVTGSTRILFSFLCVALTASFLIVPFRLNKYIAKVFRIIGHISYSIYLIHPIVFWTVNSFMNRNEYPYLFFGLCVVITGISSLIVYYAIEAKMIAVGKKISKYLAPKPIS